MSSTTVHKHFDTPIVLSFTFQCTGVRLHFWTLFFYTCFWTISESSSFWPNRNTECSAPQNRQTLLLNFQHKVTFYHWIWHSFARCWKFFWSFARFKHSEFRYPKSERSSLRKSKQHPQSFCSRKKGIYTILECLKLLKTDDPKYTLSYFQLNKWIFMTGNEKILLWILALLLSILFWNLVLSQFPADPVDYHLLRRGILLSQSSMNDHMKGFSNKVLHLLALRVRKKILGHRTERL